MSVDHKSQTEFNQAVDYIRQNYAQMSQQAVEQMQRFKWDKINQEYLNLYQLITKESINE
jgi:glycosyltransferase involved in cell wall biosynthesis